MTSLVLTDGELIWNETLNAFDLDRSSALPPALQTRFEDEPLHCDFRWAQKGEIAKLPEAEYENVIGSIAATFHGRGKG
jgi:hypothetical protein